MRNMMIKNWTRNILASALAVGMFTACGGGDSQGPTNNQAQLLADGEACAATWNISTAYTGGARVSSSGRNYTAAYWTQGNNPSTTSGAAGSGQPWTTGFTCGSSGTTTTTKAATTTTKASTTTTKAVTTTTAVTSCNYANWVSGQNYLTGNIVRYAANGNYYRASHDNPGYNPTISTWYWDSYACNTSTTTTTKASTTTTASTSTTTVATCNYANWVSGQNYVVGNTVRYAANGNYYKASHDNPGYDPTISTYFWDQTTCTGTVTTSATTTTTGTTPTTTNIGLPAKIVAGYYPNWYPNAIRVRDLPANYNLVYLFSAYAAPGDTSGRVTFSYPPGAAGTNLNADINYARTTQRRKIMLSVGGAGHGMYFHNRTESQTFVNSIVAIYNQLGGIDGMDWNTFEADTAPSTDEMIWISLELKRRYPGFIISAPPAPWNPLDKTFCQTMVQAGAMDYAAPQYYDGPGLNEPSYVVPNVADWVRLLGASRVVVGFGINNATNYMTPTQANTIWNQVKAANPTIRGGFDWEINTDQAQGWPFANGVGALIKN